MHTHRITNPQVLPWLLISRCNRREKDFRVARAPPLRVVQRVALLPLPAPLYMAPGMNIFGRGPLLSILYPQSHKRLRSLKVESIMQFSAHKNKPSANHWIPPQEMILHFNFLQCFFMCYLAWVTLLSLPIRAQKQSQGESITLMIQGAVLSMTFMQLAWKIRSWHSYF